MLEEPAVAENLGHPKVVLVAVAAGKLGHTKVLVTESLLRLARLEQGRERKFELPHLIDHRLDHRVIATVYPDRHSLVGALSSGCLNFQKQSFPSSPLGLRLCCILLK